MQSSQSFDEEDELPLSKLIPAPAKAKEEAASPEEEEKQDVGGNEEEGDATSKYEAVNGSEKKEGGDDDKEETEGADDEHDSNNDGKDPAEKTKAQHDEEQHDDPEKQDDQDEEKQDDQGKEAASPQDAKDEKDDDRPKDETEREDAEKEDAEMKDASQDKPDNDEPVDETSKDEESGSPAEIPNDKKQDGDVEMEMEDAEKKKDDDDGKSEKAPSSPKKEQVVVESEAKKDDVEAEPHAKTETTSVITTTTSPAKDTPDVEMQVADQESDAEKEKDDKSDKTEEAPSSPKKEQAVVDLEAKQDDAQADLHAKTETNTTITITASPAKDTPDVEMQEADQESDVKDAEEKAEPSAEPSAPSEDVDTKTAHAPEEASTKETSEKQEEDAKMEAVEDHVELTDVDEKAAAADNKPEETSDDVIGFVNDDKEARPAEKNAEEEKVSTNTEEEKESEPKYDSKAKMDHTDHDMDDKHKEEEPSGEPKDPDTTVKVIPAESALQGLDGPDKDSADHMDNAPKAEEPADEETKAQPEVEADAEEPKESPPAIGESSVEPKEDKPDESTVTEGTMAGHDSTQIKDSEKAVVSSEKEGGQPKVDEASSMTPKAGEESSKQVEPHLDAQVATDRESLDAPALVKQSDEAQADVDQESSPEQGNEKAKKGETGEKAAAPISQDTEKEDTIEIDMQPEAGNDVVEEETDNAVVELQHATDGDINLSIDIVNSEEKASVTGDAQGDDEKGSDAVDLEKGEANALTDRSLTNDTTATIDGSMKTGEEKMDTNTVMQDVDPMVVEEAASPNGEEQRDASTAMDVADIAEVVSEGGDKMVVDSTTSGEGAPKSEGAHDSNETTMAVASYSGAPTEGADKEIDEIQTGTPDAETVAQAPVDLPSPAPKMKPVVIPQWDIESESDEDENVDYFGAFNKTSISKSKKKATSFKIATLASNPKGKHANKDSDKDKGEPVSKPVFLGTSFDDYEYEEGLEDSLDFFNEPHEEQDPAFVEFQKAQKQKVYASELKMLDVEDEAGKRQIEELIAEQLKEKQVNTDRSLEKYKARTATEEKKDVQRLLQMSNDKSTSNQDKINQGVQVLRKRHQQESSKVLQQHRQQVQQRRLPEPMATAEWGTVSQRLRAKQQRQLQEFAGKGEEVKKRTEDEFKRDQDKLRKQYEKRMRDIESNRQSMYARIYAGFQQLRQRYIKRHMQKMVKKREELMRLTKDEPAVTSSKEEASPSPRDVAKRTKEDRVELRPPSPLKTSGDWIKETSHERSGAATRHKHRKGVLSQINKQLSVEIHNEGIWISVLLDKNGDVDAEKSKKNDPSSIDATDDKSGEAKPDDNQFIPWGIKARDMLESIICGEIPHGYGSDRFDFGETIQLYGGHIRCVMTDLRTSDETASKQRASAVQEFETVSMLALEKKRAEMTALASNAEKSFARAEKEEKEITLKIGEAEKDLEKMKRNLQNFQTKFAKYLGADGNPVPTANPSDRQKLLKAATQYTNSVDAADKREKLAISKLAEVKAQSAKYQALIKQAQRGLITVSAMIKKKTMGYSPLKYSDPTEPERPSSRVKDAVSALRISTEKRREQLNQKRISSTSSAWAQSLPGVPGALKKSLWHKMHRRRQQVVLRPSLESLAADLRTSVSEIPAPGGNRPLKAYSVEEEIQKAEQLFLLSMHPAAPVEEPLRSVPSSGSNDQWAEPGWRLVLDVPKGQQISSILPCAPSFPLLEHNLSELHSAPGCQAASMIGTVHLRSLMCPLSAVATATSLAEANLSATVSSIGNHAEKDPLNISEKAMSMGYSFGIKKPPPVVRAPAPRKKVISSKEKAAATTASTASKKNTPHGSASVRSSHFAATTATAIASGPAPAPATAKPERKRRAPAQPSRPAPKRKPDPKQAYDASAQPRNFIPQQTADPNLHAAHGNFNRRPSMEQPASQYNQFMKPMPTQNPNSPAQQRATFQQQLLQQQQQQQQPQQFSSPQQRQMAQLRMMQQPSQPGSQVPYGQSPSTMQQASQPGQQLPYGQGPSTMQQPSQPGQQVPYGQGPSTMQQPSQPGQQVPYGQGPSAMQQPSQPGQQVPYGQGLQQMQQFFAPVPQQQFQQQPMAMPGRVVGPPVHAPMNMQGNMPGNMQGNNMVRRGPQGDEQSDPLFMLKDM